MIAWEQYQGVYRHPFFLQNVRNLLNIVGGAFIYLYQNLYLKGVQVV